MNRTSWTQSLKGRLSLWPGLSSGLDARINEADVPATGKNGLPVLDPSWAPTSIPPRAAPFSKVARRLDEGVDMKDVVVHFYEHDREFLCIFEDMERWSRALSHAGVSANDAIFVKAGLDWDDGKVHYEVEFYAGNTEYDYDIDAVSGAVLSYDREWDDFSLKGYQNTDSSTGTGSTSQSNLITEAKAKEIALAKAPAGATVVKCKLDRDDGRYVYEIEMRSGYMEYECDINAVTGVIIDWDADWDD